MRTLFLAALMATAIPMTAAAAPADVKASVAATANMLAGLSVGCSGGGRSPPGRYPRSAAAASSSSRMAATTRPVALSIPGIGTPIDWFHTTVSAGGTTSSWHG